MARPKTPSGKPHPKGFKPLFNKRIKRPVKRYLRRRDRSPERRFLFSLLKIFTVLAAPFVVLIRGAVYLHTKYLWPAWPAVLGGVLATTLLLWIYWMLLQNFWRKKVSKSQHARLRRFRAERALEWIHLKQSFLMTLLIVLTYSLYALLYISADHVSDERVRRQFHTLHPILRLSVSTLILIDKDLLITDTARLPEDYRRMGLPTARHSLHYRQSNGYSHALDLRTRGRGWLRNRSVQLYFSILGFNTLRHVGTADHLHVSLSSHDRLGAI